MNIYKKHGKKVIVYIMVISISLALLIACGAGVNEAQMDESAKQTQESNGKTESKRPEEIYRFESSALHEPDAVTINPEGLPLNIGCQDCQDIYYASRSFTVDQAAIVVKEKFGVQEMIEDENFIRFDLHIDKIRQLELELDLIAARKLDSPKEIIDIRITSIAPQED